MIADEGNASVLQQLVPQQAIGPLSRRCHFIPSSHSRTSTAESRRLPCLLMLIKSYQCLMCLPQFYPQALPKNQFAPFSFLRTRIFNLYWLTCWLRCLTWLQFVLLIRLQSVCQRVSGATMESGGGICHGYSDWIGVIDFDGLAVWLRVTSYDFVWLRGFAASSIPFRKVSQGFGSLFGYFCSSLLETLLLGRLSDHPELRPSKLWRSCRSCEGRAAKACRAKLPERLWLVTCTHLFAVPLKFVILEDQHFFIAIKQHPLGSLWSTLRNEERPFTLSGPSWQN